MLAAAAGRRQFPHTPLADGDEVGPGRADTAGAGHPRAHRRAPVLPAARRRPGTGGVHRRVADRRLGRPHRPARRRPGRGLARAQYRSLRRLAALPRATAVWPTHGAGSFCSAPPGAARVTTIGAEKGFEPAAGRAGRGNVRRPPAGQPGLLPRLLRPASPRSTARPRPGTGPAWPAHRASVPAAGGRRRVACGLPRAHPRRGPSVRDGRPGGLAGPAGCRWLRARRRAGPGRGRLAGPQGRLREPGRAAGRRHGRLAGRRRAGERNRAGQRRSPRRPPGTGRPAGQRVPAGHIPGAVHIELGDLPGRAQAAPRARW